VASQEANLKTSTDPETRQATDLETRQALLDLRTALRRLNPKRLGRYFYVSRMFEHLGITEYCMCSLGALRCHLTHKGRIDQDLLRRFYDNSVSHLPVDFEWSSIHKTIADQNDFFEGTEEQRYTHMMKWVERQLKRQLKKLPK
jgi:hypothetical protein